jgi:histidinol-phosphate aminotransferase
LQELGAKTYSSAGNFLLANFGPGGPALFRKIEKQGILLRERTKDMGAGFVRISIGTSTEMKKLLKAIRKEWKALS